jgi:hypothetical protein
MINRKAKRILRLLNDPRQKKRLLDALNRETVDDAAQVGRSEITILKDMESLDQEHDQYMLSLKDRSRSD